MDSRARMMLEALNLASASQQSPQSPQQSPQQPQRYATGGSVGLPTLQQMSDPNFDFSSMGKFAPTTFMPMTQNVPMFVAQSPAYGNMGQDVFDFKAPTARAAPQPYTTVNQPVAITRNRRVPEQVATVNVPMPSYATPMPNVPGAGDTATIAPSPVSIATPATPVANPLGPDPFEVRRSEAAAELDSYNQRQAAEAAQMAEARRVAEAAAAQRAQESAAQQAAAQQAQQAAAQQAAQQQQEQAAAQQAQETAAQQEQQRVQNEVNARIASEEAERKRIADAAAASKEQERQMIANAFSRSILGFDLYNNSPSPSPERQFVTTNYESGEGYYTEDTNWLDSDYRDEASASNSGGG